VTPRERLRTVLPPGLAAVAAAALLLPWWRADRGAVLLGAGPLEELAPDRWTGIEAAGPQAAVLGGLAVLAAVLAVGVVARATGATPPARLVLLARYAAVAAGAVAVAVAGTVLVDRGAVRAAGAWVALLAGSAGLVAAIWLRGPPQRGRVAVVAVMVLAALAAVAVVPAVPQPPHRNAVGPFVLVAAVGPFPLRSGAAGLAAADDARPVLADGSPGLVSRAGIVVADDRGRAQVLARTDRGAPAPLGVAGDRLARWTSADTVTVSGLRPDDTLHVVVRGVTEAGPVGADGSLWLRTDADPDETVRRLDLAERDGTQRLAATFLPVVTVQEPEPPVDVRSVLPVRNGGLRVLGASGGLELLTVTAVGLAAAPLAGTACAATGAAGLARVAADGTGVWFVVAGQDGDRLAHLDRRKPAAVTTVSALLPGHVSALVAPGDGSLLFVASDAAGEALWRLPDAAAALGGTLGPPDCPAAP
jgi:hypothetical protein